MVLVFENVPNISVVAYSATVCLVLIEMLILSPRWGGKFFEETVQLRVAFVQMLCALIAFLIGFVVQIMEWVR